MFYLYVKHIHNVNQKCYFYLSGVLCYRWSALISTSREKAYVSGVIAVFLFFIYFYNQLKFISLLWYLKF